MTNITSKKPSVLFLNRVYLPQNSGTARMAWDLSRAMASKGWRVTVISAKGQSHNGMVANNIRSINVGYKGDPRSIWGNLIISLKMFWAAANCRKHDLVISMTDPIMNILMASLLCKLKDSRHIHWCQDLYPDLLRVFQINVPEFVYNFLNKASISAMKSADRVVVIGRCMARRVVGKGVPAGKVSVIPNWYDSMLTDDGTKNKNRNKRKKKQSGASILSKPLEALFKSDEPRFRVMYAGNLGLGHPYEAIMDAAEILEKDHPEIEFVFVGDSRMSEKISLERTKRKLQNVKLLPYQPSEVVRKVLETGDVHIAALSEDATGLMVPSKVYSSFAVGRPCIFMGSVHCEVAMAIKSFKAGVVIPSGKGKILAEAIKQFRFDGKVWFEAKKGADEAAKNFVPEESINAWIKRAEDVVLKI